MRPCVCLSRARRPSDLPDPNMAMQTDGTPTSQSNRRNTANKCKSLISLEQPAEHRHLEATGGTPPKETISVEQPAEHRHLKASGGTPPKNANLLYHGCSRRNTAISTQPAEHRQKKQSLWSSRRNTAISKQPAKQVKQMQFSFSMRATGGTPPSLSNRRSTAKQKQPIAFRMPAVDLKLPRVCQSTSSSKLFRACFFYKNRHGPFSGK